MKLRKKTQWFLTGSAISLLVLAVGAFVGDAYMAAQLCAIGAAVLGLACFTSRRRSAFRTTPDPAIKRPKPRQKPSVPQ